MSYADRKEFGPRQATALGLSLLLIGFLSWAFINGLVVKVMKIAVGPVKLIKPKDLPPPPDTPPPPPPKLDEVPPYVPPPEVDVSVPQMNTAPAIQTQNVVEKPKERVVEAPPPPPPPPPRKIIAADASRLNNAIRNLSEYYPPRAQELKQEGTSICTYVIPVSGRIQDGKCEGAGDLLDRAAEKLINSQKVKPASEDGLAIASSAGVRIKWVLPKDE